MSSIGPSSFGSYPQVNPYAGSVRGPGSTDADRVNSADRAGDTDRQRFADGFQGTNETSESGDRDADGSYFPGRSAQDKQKHQDESNDVTLSPIGLPRQRRPADDHRGNLLDVDA